MENRISKKKMIGLLLCGLAGCILMGGSDWLMIYGDPSYEGGLMWLTLGVGQAAPWRNALAMVLAFPAVLCYAAALLGLGRLIRDRKQERRYLSLTAVGLTPWLCLHLFYVMIFYIFHLFTLEGAAREGGLLAEAVVSHFGWLIPVSDVLMVLPFLWLLWLTASGKTVMPRAMALHNPLILFAVLKAITMVMPVSAFRLAFINGLMSESMLLWFLGILIWLTARKEK